MKNDLIKNIFVKYCLWLFNNVFIIHFSSYTVQCNEENVPLLDNMHICSALDCHSQPKQFYVTVILAVEG